MKVNEEVNKPLESCFDNFCSRKRSDCVTPGFDLGQYFKLVDPFSVPNNREIAYMSVCC